MKYVLFVSIKFSVSSKVFSSSDGILVDQVDCCNDWWSKFVMVGVDLMVFW